MGPWPENRGGEGGTPWARGLKTRGGGILGILGRLKVFWGPSWGHLGAVLGRLGAVLEPSWGRLGPSWRRLGPSWGVLGPSWGLSWPVKTRQDRPRQAKTGQDKVLSCLVLSRLNFDQLLN